MLRGLVIRARPRAVREDPAWYTPGVLPLSAKLTPEAFLTWEREQPTRYHYIGGEVFDMSGGSPRHNRLGLRAGGLLDRAMGGTGCVAFSADQKLALGQDVFVYADVSVVCGPLELRPGHTDVLTNPAVVVEVLSKSTEGYDRGDKQRGYLALPSLVHLLFVSQREVRVELYTRQDDGSFRFEVFGPGAMIELRRPKVSLAVDELYSGALALPGDD